MPKTLCILAIDPGVSGALAFYFPAAPEAVTADQVCAVAAQAQRHVRRLGEQAAESMARVVPTLQPEQLRHLAQQFDKHNRNWREEWLDGTPQELLARRL